MFHPAAACSLMELLEYLEKLPLVTTLEEMELARVARRTSKMHAAIIPNVLDCFKIAA